MRIGIDVGGTNTDAVLVDGTSVRATIKVPTTEDVTGGVLASLQSIATHAEASRVGAVMIGTTHFINAVVQRKDLCRVAAIRIGAPASTTLPPLCDWPQDLAAIVDGGHALVEGGHEVDGRLFVPLDHQAVCDAARAFADRGQTAFAITSAFSPIDPSHEDEAAAIVQEAVPDAVVTKSADLGRIGLLERENAAIMNAALGPLAARTIGAFERAIAASGFAARLYITQNDGTVVDAATAIRQPVYAFASGATNSMRGAAVLSGRENAMVVDVGGTTTDAGELRQGFPREANAVVNIGGVRTLFRMPDVSSIGLGGGSLVTLDPPTVGPQSVGYRLTREALVFGGNTLTATDVGVAAGRLDLGDKSRVSLPEGAAAQIEARVHDMLAELVDRMKTVAGDVPVIAVGGGAFLVPERLSGASTVMRVAHGDCANAVGAAIAQVSGEVDRVFKDYPRNAALAEAADGAREAAIAAGAAPDSVRVIDSEDIPLAYLPGNSVRVRVRAVGDIAAE
jgi:N-methylhydantoinase A/oxoprolinase/acetone carboxylase beta subunit